MSSPIVIMIVAEVFELDSLGIHKTGIWFPFLSVSYVAEISWITNSVIGGPSIKAEFDIRDVISRVSFSWPLVSHIKRRSADYWCPVGTHEREWCVWICFIGHSLNRGNHLGWEDGLIEQTIHAAPNLLGTGYVDVIRPSGVVVGQPKVNTSFAIAFKPSSLPLVQQNKSFTPKIS